MKRSLRIVLPVLLALATLAAVIGAFWHLNQPAPEPERRAVPAPSPTYSVDTRPTIEVYGDSVTMMDSPAIAHGDTGPASWVHYIGANGLRYIGGYAEGGLKAAAVAPHLAPEHTSDIVLWELGTNDLVDEVAWDSHAESMKQFHDAVGLREGDRFVVMAVGPLDKQDPARVAEWNEQSKAFATENGWGWIDPWEGLRDDDGGWMDGLSEDGMHPTEESAKLLSENIGKALLQ